MLLLLVFYIKYNCFPKLRACWSYLTQKLRAACFSLIITSTHQSQHTWQIHQIHSSGIWRKKISSPTQISWTLICSFGDCSLTILITRGLLNNVNHCRKPQMIIFSPAYPMEKVQFCLGLNTFSRKTLCPLLSGATRLIQVAVPPERAVGEKDWHCSEFHWLSCRGVMSCVGQLGSWHWRSPSQPRGGKRDATSPSWGLTPRAVHTSTRSPAISGNVWSSASPGEAGKGEPLLHPVLCYKPKYLGVQFNFRG